LQEKYKTETILFINLFSELGKDHHYLPLVVEHIRTSRTILDSKCYSSNDSNTKYT